MQALDPELTALIPLLGQSPPRMVGADQDAFFDKRHDVVDVFINTFVTEGTEVRAAIIEATRRCVAAFAGYAGWAAIQSVRAGDPRLVFRGMVALAIDNHRYGHSDTLQSLSLLARSARKLQGTEDLAFGPALELATPAFAAFVRQFLARPVPHRDIGAMGFYEMGDGPTFTYEQDRAPPPTSMCELLDREDKRRAAESQAWPTAER